MKSYAVQIIVPCYNEEHRLPREKFLRFLNDEKDVHLLFVDDGSRDGTYEALRGIAGASSANAAVLKLEKNGGKAEAVRQGFMHAMKLGKFDAIGFWDADLATPLDEIAPFIKLLKERPELDMVLGARVKLMGRDIRRKLTRHYLGRVFATAASTALGMSIYDTQCGAKLLRYNEDLAPLFEKPFCSKWIFDVEILARYRLVHSELRASEIEHRIYEYPLPVWHDVAGSKVKPADFFRAFSELMVIYMKYRAPWRRKAALRDEIASREPV